VEKYMLHRLNILLLTGPVFGEADSEILSTSSTLTIS